jgi:hypothetical protein
LGLNRRESIGLFGVHSDTVVRGEVLEYSASASSIDFFAQEA